MARASVGRDAKPPRPVRIGCDLADADAVAESITAFGERYLSRVYSATERAQTGEAPVRLAARFAGKEAVLKVLRNSSDIRYDEIEIVLDAEGAPWVRLAPRAQQRANAEQLGPIAISLSHERGMALATAVAIPDYQPLH
ncbi:holo-ACP synthase [Propionicimonas sp.]|uniref:holo-ACP synthase n=1 Tax=Propionicimonas sp. TaxID=1955623 RepID=UPI0018131F97|nr:holo-ACP synthase [Propionicimonas sp.]MBU3975818.1 holo-ACP synthase [Actinomycetota bacterium]MBA3022193.1 holo-ACP synthase [Propionicimonas sp.]MBU3987368.1 holo-ACP synthase [Actinomycetota bacterium]MBU4006413.1 holo-ACP synthase [Actinomycetota bacterium]MBU4065292.1 holo-ACP synthase [Actinomycetota bacterium]